MNRLVEQTLGTLIAGLFAAQVSCATVNTNTPAISPPKHEISTATKSVQCISLTSIYLNIEDPTDIDATGGTGTGLVFAYDNGYSYILTAKHVVESEQVIKIELPGIFIIDPATGEVQPLESSVTYNKVSESLKIVDDINDTDTTDDIPLEVVVKSETHDVVIVRAKGKLPLTKFKVGTTEGLAEGQEIYFIGFQQGEEYHVSDGIISNIGVGLDEEAKDSLAINSTVVDGGSGGPLFIEGDNGLELIGMCNMSMLYEGIPVDFAYCIKVDAFKDLLDVKKYR